MTQGSEGRTGVAYCSTTMMSPSHQNCVMPTASAQGGGSFPGSFLVPGTNTSFAVHGFIRFDIVHDFGPHIGVNSWGPEAIPVEGLGASTANLASHATNGGTELQAATTRPNIETRTPTAYGELKTYIEFDFNENSGLAQQGAGGTSAITVSGNNDLIRLRQAYGTLGPWLIGQAFSAFADAQAYSDVANGTQDIGMMNTFNVRRPQIRYTWLAGNGLSLAGSIEQPTYVGDVSYSSTPNGAAVGAGPTFGTSSTFGNWPSFVLAPEWDQPWGHVKLAVGGEVNDTRSFGTAGDIPGPSTGINRETGGVAVALTGHLNTWGKDALRGGVVYDNGAANFTSEMAQGGELYNTTTGQRSAVKEWAGYASYEHFFNGQWRANATGGYAKLSGNPGWTSVTTLASLNKKLFDTNVNVIYSPVPQTDFIFEWEHAYRDMFSSANGTDNRIDAQFNFYF